MIDPSTEFLCPISQDFMDDPVRTTTGQIYDRKSIEVWFKNHNTDPLSNIEIKDKKLTSLPELKERIDDYKKGEAIGFYHSGMAAIENKNYVPAKAFFKTAIETKKTGELSEEQIQLAQYYIHKLSGEYLEAMLCLTQAVLLKSKIAFNEFKDHAFIPIDKKIHDDDKLFLLTVCAALAMGFSGQSDMFFGGFNNKWQNKCTSQIAGIFGNLSASSSGGYIHNADAYFDWVREKGAETTLNFFYACVSQKIITLNLYVRIINNLLKNNKNAHFKNKAYYDLHKAILLLDPQHCNAFCLNNITPEFLSSQINDPDELVGLNKIFQSISDEAMRTRLKNEFFEVCNVGNMMMTSNPGDKASLSKANIMSISEECWIHYTKGCESMAKGDYTPAKAHFLAAIELGFPHHKQLCDTYYRLGIIHRHSKQYVEAMGYFTKALLFNTPKSEQIIQELLKDSLMPDELLSICSVIVMVFSGRFFEERDVNQLFNPHFNKYINSFTTRNYLSSDKIQPIPFNWIKMISCNLENLEKALQFFNYCLSHKIIKPEIYEYIILSLNISLDKINHNCEVDEINEANYVLFKAFLSTHPQKAENYLKKIPPLYLYSQMNNSSEISDLQKIPLSSKYIILDKLSSKAEDFQDPNYCKVVSKFLDTMFTNNLVPKDILECHIRNLYMCSGNYDVLKLRESALARLNTYPNQSKSLLMSMHSHKISDNEKMSCAINHIMILFENSGYSGELLKDANNIAHIIQQFTLHHSDTDEYNFTLLNEFYESLCKIDNSNSDIQQAFHESKRILRDVIKEVGCNITLPPIEIQEIENAISNMMLLLNILYRSKTQNPQKSDSLLATAMTFFENNFNPNPEIPLIQSCLKETTRIQAIIDDATLVTEELHLFLDKFKKYIEGLKRENKSIIKEDSLDVFNEIIKTCDHLIKRLDQEIKKNSTHENLIKRTPFS